jgi:L-ascorbate metabolism protein UlaG (beta-lactamase superfamily)
VAMLPIGDNFTMGPEDAVQAVQFLHPKSAILMHYDTFDVIAQDEESVADMIKNQTGTKPVVMRPGETMTL